MSAHSNSQSPTLSEHTDFDLTSHSNSKHCANAMAAAAAVAAANLFRPWDAKLNQNTLNLSKPFQSDTNQTCSDQSFSFNLNNSSSDRSVFTIKAEKCAIKMNDIQIKQNKCNLLLKGSRNKSTINRFSTADLFSSSVAAAAAATYGQLMQQNNFLSANNLYSQLCSNYQPESALFKSRLPYANIPSEILSAASLPSTPLIPSAAIPSLINTSERSKIPLNVISTSRGSTSGTGVLSKLEGRVRKPRPKRFRCPHCDIAFSNNGQLKGHIRTHTGTYKFLYFVLILL